jgi:hypothetical protein
MTNLVQWKITCINEAGVITVLNASRMASGNCFEYYLMLVKILKMYNDSCAIRRFLQTNFTLLCHSLLSVVGRIVPSIYWLCYCTDWVRLPARLGVIIIIIIIIISPL